MFWVTPNVGLPHNFQWDWHRGASGCLERGDGAFVCGGVRTFLLGVLAIFRISLQKEGGIITGRERVM